MKITPGNTSRYRRVFFSAGLVAGILAGLWTFRGLIQDGKPPFWTEKVIKLIFGARLHLAGAEGRESFLFYDFESAEQIRAWHPSGSIQVTISSQNPLSGHSSARLDFLGGRYASAVCDNLLRSRSGGSDWRGFREFRLTAEASAEGPQLIALALTDLRGAQYREVMRLSAGQALRLSVPVDKIGRFMDTSRIDTVAIFSLNPPGRKSSLRFDDVGLKR